MKKLSILAAASLLAPSFLIGQITDPPTPDSSSTNLISVQPDQYIGGNDDGDFGTNYTGTDLIGNAGVFEVHGTLTEFILDSQGVVDGLKISVFSEYFDNILSGSGLLGTNMGDILISDAGINNDLNGDPITEEDDLTGDSWDYVVNLPETTGTSVGNADVLGVTNADLDDSFVNTAGDFRDSQYVQLDQDSNSATSTGVTASWEIKTVGSLASDPQVQALDDPQDLAPSTGDDTNISGASIGSNDKYLEVVFTLPADLQPTIGDVSTLGFQWAMTCANDVTQWEVTYDATPVPEPAAIAFLTMLGLGLIVYRRRKQATAA